MSPVRKSQFRLAMLLCLLAGFMASAAKAQFTFATAQVLDNSTTWGVVTNDNSATIPDIGAPSIAGNPPNAPLWYQWTAPQDGEVTLDTIGSSGLSFSFIDLTPIETPIDTVIGVYTGNSLLGLSQVAVNDDLYPINTSNPQLNISGSADYIGSVGIPFTSYSPPFYGPSALKFNAKAGQTYYFAVDSKTFSFLSSGFNFISYSSYGVVSLNWAYKPSGAFRFATEDVDPTTGLIQYQAAMTESMSPAGTAADAGSVVSSYYSYNAPGLLVTVTRAAGSTGRATVDYMTVDGSQLPSIPTNDVAAYQLYTNVNVIVDSSNAVLNMFTNYSSGDYSPVSGTLVFDDYEMSKTILVPINSQGGYLSNPSFQTNRLVGNRLVPLNVVQNYSANAVFGVVLTNAQLDLLESADVSQPRVDPNFGVAMVRILNTKADPYGPSFIPNIVTNIVGGVTNVVTNLVQSLYTTNVQFNFEKANFRVPADVNDPNVSPWVHCTVYVERTGTNTAAQTLDYRVNCFLEDNFGGDEEMNNQFPLQAGSDYAVPEPPTWGVIRGTNTDFVLARGTLSFPSTGAGVFYQPINFTVPTSLLTKFNKDFKIQIYKTVNNAAVLVGMVNETTVTILFNDQNPPAGSVDEMHNADYNTEMALYAAQVPSTTPPDNSNPGVGLNGQVNTVIALDNGEAFLGGDFSSYNGISSNNISLQCVALVNADGSPDTSFNGGSGANAAVLCAATNNGQIYIGGSFTSYDGSSVPRIARLNLDGSIDLSFAPGTGANGPVRAIAVTASGQILIGGDFTIFNGLTCNHIALLNTDGSVDTSFNGGANLTGGGASVYALAVQGTQFIVGGNFGVVSQNYKNLVRLNSNGSVDTSFNVGTGANGLVRALVVLPNNQMLVGGEFTQINGAVLNRLARLNSNGTVDTSFYNGTGADNAVFCIALQADGTFYVGGTFSSINGTHRLGFARLYANGTVDTTFMDTACNQFAGLKRIYSSDLPGVFSTSVQPDGNVLIGGSFNQVGGGQVSSNSVNTLDFELGYTFPLTYESFEDPNLWVEPKARDGVRNRSGFARLIGGATPGPGNIGFGQSNFSQNKSQSTLTVPLLRTNGVLGPVVANFSVLNGTATSGLDYSYSGNAPVYWQVWDYLTHPSRVHNDGLTVGPSGLLIDPYGLYLTLSDSSISSLSKVVVSVINNKSSSGNVSAKFQLANPSTTEQFYLGGQPIPLGTGLGVASATFTINDDTTYPGNFGFSSPSFIATNLSPVISVLRSNGVYGTVSMQCSSSNGTATVGTDYVGLTNKNLIFGPNVLSNGFTVTVKGNSYITNIEKTVNLRLFNLGTTPGATFGYSNAVLRIINPNYKGYLTLDSTNYTSSMSSGAIQFVVDRVTGSSGVLSIQYATTNGTAVSGTDYIGATNTLTWNNGDVTPQIVTIPLINTGVVGPNKQFGVRLFNPTNNGVADAALMGIISNATLVISNDNSYGTLQLSASSYLVNEIGGTATITVTRSGGAIGNVQVHYATSDGSATNGVNYVATNGVLALAAGQTSASFDVKILNDQMVDTLPFYFNVALSSPTNAALGSPANAAVNIVDASSYNQPPGSPDTSFSAQDINGSVFSLAFQSDNQILVGGSFSAIGPVLRNRIARLNTDGSLDTTFLSGLSGADGTVYSVANQTDDRVVVGGSFTSLNGIRRNFIGRLMIDGSVDTSFNPGSGADNTVNALVETFIAGVRKIYVGGAFGSYNSSSSPGIMRLNNDGTIDPTFNVGAGIAGQVYAIAAYGTNTIYAGKLLIGGSFTRYNNITNNNLVRLNIDGTLDTNYTANIGAGPNGTVRSIVIQPGGQAIVAGSFTSFNGTAANGIVRLNTDGTLDTAFATAIGSGANGSVQAVTLQPDNRILVVGQFTAFNGVTRNHITRLLSTGATDPAINFGTGANGSVNAVLVQTWDNMIVIGGGFTLYDDQPPAGIARIFGGSVTGSGEFQFTQSGYQVFENAIVATITVQRAGGTSGPNSDGSGNISVTFATTDGTAVNGVNYYGVTNTLQFPPGEVLQTVSIPVLDDLVITPDLTVNLGLSNITPPATNGVQTSSTLYIQNVDNAVCFSNAFPVVFKNTPLGAAYIDIIRLGGTNNTSTVTFATSTNGSTGVVGTDYYGTNQTVTFLPGQNDVQVHVPVINNTLPRGNKTVSLVLSNAANTTLIAPSNATLTIIDTVSAPGQLYFTATNFSATSGDAYGYLTVARTNGSSGSVTVDYQTVAGTAQPGLNYLTSSGTITFANGDTTKNIQIPLVNNPIVQPPVSLSVVLSNPGGGATLTTPTNALLTIVNTNIGFAFQNATNYYRETNGYVQVMVQRLGGSTGGVSVNYSTFNGSAVSNVNYTAVSGTLTYAAGEMLKAVSVPLIYYPKVTGDLSFQMKLTGPSPAATLLAYPSNSLVVIQDADAGISFTNDTLSVFKNSGTVSIPVVCTNTAVEPPISDTNQLPMTVNYSTINGTAQAGSDYQAASGKLYFTNGVGTNYINLHIINNSLVLGDRSLSVQLFSNTAPSQIIAPSNLVVTIVDNNSGLSFSSPNYSVLKSGVKSTVTVLRSGYTNTTSTVSFNTADGTAMAGQDYVTTNGVLTFTNGETAKTFDVYVIANTAVQPDKTVLLQLSGATNGFLIAPYASTLTIHDNSGSLVVPAGSAFAVGGDPNNNGLIDPNETVTLMLALRASGGTNVPVVYATLLASNGISSPSPSTAVNYGALAVGGASTARPFTFTANGTNSQRITATLQLNNGVTNIGTAAFTYTVGMWTNVYFNSNAIVINDFTIASPYPSTIAVTNVGAAVIKSTVTLSNLYHGFTKDIGALLVAPAGKDTLLMSHAGNAKATKITLTFDDSAATSLSDTNALVTGTNRPTAYTPTTVFP